MTTRIKIDSIAPNPKQPRTRFDEASLKELAASIQEHGMIEPIIIEPADVGYTLVSGERRLRALKINGARTLTIGKEVVIRARSNHSGRELLIMAIVENVQREDMNCIETARAYAQLQSEYGLKPAEIAKQVGKAPVQIYNQLDLLQAEPEIQDLWACKQITHEPRVVKAILSVLPGDDRVALIQGLAKHRATGKMIVAACAKFKELHQVKTRKSETKAIVHLQRLSDQRPEWEALYQLGKVPPWQAINDATMRTCDECSLRSMASEAVCGSCALVAMLDHLMGIVHASD